MFEITLNGPGKNALGTDMMNFLVGQLEQAGGQPVLLTGTGDSFSAGLNLIELSRLDQAGMLAFLRRLEKMSHALYRYPAPVVGCVNGHAIAGGCILALACDYRVISANPKIKMGLNEVALGLRFPPSILTLVRRRLPPQHLETVLLGGMLVPPTEALRLGFVDEVADDALAVAKARLTALASHSSSCYATSKADLRAPIVVGAEEERIFLEEVLPLWTSPELHQRILSVLKR